MVAYDRQCIKNIVCFIYVGMHKLNLLLDKPRLTLRCARHAVWCQRTLQTCKERVALTRVSINQWPTILCSTMLSETTATV